MRTKLEFDDLAYEVLLDTGVRIQPLPVWQSEWEYPENYSNPHLLKNIARLAIRANTGIVVAVDGRTVILTAADLIKVREKETPHH